MRTSEEANSASVGVTLFATPRFVEGGSLRKRCLSNDIAAADICRRDRGRNLALAPLGLPTALWVVGALKGRLPVSAGETLLRSWGLGAGFGERANSLVLRAR